MKHWSGEYKIAKLGYEPKHSENTTVRYNSRNGLPKYVQQKKTSN